MTKQFLATFFAVLGLLSFGAPDRASATPQAFGSGLQICAAPLQPVTLAHPTTINDCTRSGIQAALDTGGQINFSCGPNPVTIPIDSQLELNPYTDTILDGGGLVTLDGGGTSRILHKGWHDPSKVDSVTITLENLRFINGKAPAGETTGDISGGAINVGYPGTRLHIINSSFQNNSTTDVSTTDNQGGAIFVHNAYETLIAGSLFENNTAGNGGAVGAIASGMLFYNSRFIGNQAVDTSQGGIVRGYGGALHLDGVTNSYNPDSNRILYVCGSQFEENQAVRGGGATSSVVSDNKGIKATFERSSFIHNTVTGIPDPEQSGDFLYGQGGAIYHIEDDHADGSSEDNFEIRDSTFTLNEARRQGGAVWISILGLGRVINSTFEGNTTTAPYNTVGQGGAMVISLGKIDVINTVFANNHAAYQAGALHGGSADDPQRVITLTNSIFYNNTLNEQELPSSTEWQGYHTNRPMNDGGQNIQYPRLKPTYDNDVNNNVTVNPIYADPELSALADNGGPTQTMALQAGSPAIDAASSVACLAVDQRGYLRQGLCDIGPYEFGGLPFVPSRFLFLPQVYR